VVSPVAFGLITDMTGSYRLPFVMSIALLLVGIALSFWIRPDRPLQASAQPTLSTKSLGVHS
jgi:cyanate permease